MRGPARATPRQAGDAAASDGVSRDVDAARVDKVAIAHETLVEAVAAIQSGEDWRNYLSLQARLHAYSPNNVVLIALQHAAAFAEGRVPTPVPTYVAGFSTWKALGRVVERGQRGYVILAPLNWSVRVATNSEGERRVLGRGDAPAPGERIETRNSLRGFRAEHVFSAEQTTGAELPRPPAPRLLEGEAPHGLRDAIAALVVGRGFEVRTVDSAVAIGGANGQTDYDTRTVVVRADMDDAAQVKTLLHEAAHVLLHDPSIDTSRPREVCEVEAESVAFVVASTHGMATDDYSFPYVARWAGDGGVEVVRASASRVAGAARELIAASSADHGPGGRVPGADVALDAARAARGADPVSAAVPVPHTIATRPITGGALSQPEIPSCAPLRPVVEL